LSSSALCMLWESSKNTVKMYQYSTTSIDSCCSIVIYKMDSGHYIVSTSIVEDILVFERVESRNRHHQNGSSPLARMDWWMECPNETDLVLLPEWTFDRKRISSNLNPSPNLKAQKHFRKTKWRHFSVKSSDIHHQNHDKSVEYSSF